MDIGQKIKNARIEKGFTQEELGAMVGVQKSAIAKYESGRVVNIKRKTLQKLAEVLGLKGSDLIIGADPVRSAEIHVEMIMDEDLAEIFEDFRTLDSKERKIVKNLVRSLAEAKTEA